MDRSLLPSKLFVPAERAWRHAMGPLLVALLLSACAGSAETASPVPAAVGVWAYQAESQQGTYRGTLTITQAEAGGLTGSIQVDDRSVGPLEVQRVALQDSTLTFDIEGGSAGPMEATAEVRGDRLEGTIDVTNYGATLSFSAKKQSE
jgi:hypothetical protein